MFKELLKTLMEVNGINQSELARRSGLTRFTISHYMHYQQIPSAVFVQKIADALNVNVEILCRALIKDYEAREMEKEK